MQPSVPPELVTHVTSLNSASGQPPPTNPSLTTRKQPPKHVKPPKLASTSLPTLSTQSQQTNVSHPSDKAQKKLSSDPRLSKSATIKADKAAEKAAELAALATGRASLTAKIKANTASLDKKLASIESNIEKMEEDYIRTTWAHGNVLRGWDGLTRRVDRPDKTPTGNGSGVATGAPKHRKSRPSDRVFSLSSSTSHYKLHNPDVTIQKRPSTNKKKKKRC